MSEPRLLHQRVCGDIYSALRSWSETAAGRGTVALPLNEVLDEGNVLAPTSSGSTATTRSSSPPARSSSRGCCPG